jgi:predicted nuclease of predicted toxin-antitoxin system
MKLLIDMNLSPLRVPFLSSAGFAAVNWSTLGKVTAPDRVPTGIGQAVVRAIRLAQPHLERGALVTVDPSHHRVRLLPIR